MAMDYSEALGVEFREVRGATYDGKPVRVVRGRAHLRHRSGRSLGRAHQYRTHSPLVPTNHRRSPARRPISVGGQCRR